MGGDRNIVELHIKYTLHNTLYTTIDFTIDFTLYLWTTMNILSKSLVYRDYHCTVNVVKADGAYSPLYYVPRGNIGCKRIPVTSAGLRKNGNMWKSLGCILVNIVPWVVPMPQTLMACGFSGFWP